jgi:hypothetical protein
VVVVVVVLAVRSESTSGTEGTARRRVGSPSAVRRARIEARVGLRRGAAEVSSADEESAGTSPPGTAGTSESSEVSASPELVAPAALVVA